MNKITQYCPERITSDQSAVVAVPEKSLAIFDPAALSLLNTISKFLLADKNFNRSPEIAALGFWLRKSNIERMEEENSHWLRSPAFSVNPLGTVFHVAPSNVDTIFLYSLCISLLMGNSNIVRVSSAPLTPAADFIISCINKALAEKEFRFLKDYIRIITYNHDESINTFLSSHANGRVIWGGNETVSHFRAVLSSVYCKDILFPNRVSYSIIKASAFIDSNAETKQSVALDFFNDAYTFDQLGCSSPRLIFVQGSEDEKIAFSKDFYSCLSSVALKRYGDRAALLSVQKFNRLAGEVISGKVTGVQHSNNSAYFVETENESPEFESCFGGYFYLYRLDKGSFAPLKKMVSESAQTLTWYGFERDELDELNCALYGKRIDRIAPIGEALSFHYIWDGMNLFEELSRKRFLGRTRNRM